MPNDPLSNDADRTILLVADDAAADFELASMFGRFGYLVRAVESHAVIDALTDRLPAAIVVRERFGVRADPLAAIAEFERRRDCPVPLIVLSDGDDMVARLRAARAGASAYFAAPADPRDIVDAVDVMTGRLAGSPHRVIIVVEEPHATESIRAWLDSAGMTTCEVNRPDELLVRLREFQPDLLVLGLHFNGMTGAELAAIVRQLPKFAGLPIVFVSTDPGASGEAAAIRQAGDELIVLPVPADEFVVAVRARACRSRAVQSLMTRDGLTGLVSHSRTREQLEIEVARAKRGDGRLALALIDVDHFKRVNDTHGHAAGDRLLQSVARTLRHRLRRTDLIGRLGGDEFAVILVDADGPNAERLMNELRAELAARRHPSGEADFAVTLSCGIATFPEFADAAALDAAADRALYEAKRSGRDRVVVARP